MLKKKC